MENRADHQLGDARLSLPLVSLSLYLSSTSFNINQIFAVRSFQLCLFGEHWLIYTIRHKDGQPIVRPGDEATEVKATKLLAWVVVKRIAHNRCQGMWLSCRCRLLCDAVIAGRLMANMIFARRRKVSQQPFSAKLAWINSRRCWGLFLFMLSVNRVTFGADGNENFTSTVDAFDNRFTIDA